MTFAVNRTRIQMEGRGACVCRLRGSDASTLDLIRVMPAQEVTKNAFTGAPMRQPLFFAKKRETY